MKKLSKVKLIKIYGKYCHYEEYDSVIRCIVEGQSDFEEVTVEELGTLHRFVDEYNQRNYPNNFYIVASESDVTVREAIKTTLEKEAKIQEELTRVENERKRIAKEKYAAGAAKREEKRRLKLERELKELQEKLKK
jgi:UV DNA damage repair endonuclease